jgi:hypothetical protein
MTDDRDPTYYDPDDVAGPPLGDLGDPGLNDALGRVFDSGALRTAFDALTAGLPDPDPTAVLVDDIRSHVDEWRTAMTARVDRVRGAVDQLPRSTGSAARAEISRIATAVDRTGRDPMFALSYTRHVEFALNQLVRELRRISVDGTPILPDPLPPLPPTRHHR